MTRLDVDYALNFLDELQRSLFLLYRGEMSADGEELLKLANALESVLRTLDVILRRRRVEIVDRGNGFKITFKPRISANCTLIWRYENVPRSFDFNQIKRWFYEEG